MESDYINTSIASLKKIYPQILLPRICANEHEWEIISEHVFAFVRVTVAGAPTFKHDMTSKTSLDLKRARCCDGATANNHDETPGKPLGPHLRTGRCVRLFGFRRF